MATVYATVDGKKQAVNVNAAGKTTSNLPVGSVVHTAGGDYRITGGTAGNYTSVKMTGGYNDVGASAPTPSGYTSSGYSDVGASGRSSGSSSTNAGTAASIVQATLPNGQKTQVSVVNGKTVTPNLPAGTTIHTAGGNYTITGGSAGNYTSTPASSFTPSVAGSSSAASSLPAAAQGLFNAPVLPNLESNFGNLRGVESVTGNYPQPSVGQALKTVLPNVPGAVGQIASAVKGVGQGVANVAQWASQPKTVPEGVIPYGGLGGAASYLISQFKPTTSQTTPTAQETWAPIPTVDEQSLRSQTGSQGQVVPLPTGYNVPNTMTPTTGNAMTSGMPPSESFNFRGTGLLGGQNTMAQPPAQSPTVATAPPYFDPSQYMNGFARCAARVSSVLGRLAATGTSRERH
jgi:hypothetical protein